MGTNYVVKQRENLAIGIIQEDQASSDRVVFFSSAKFCLQR